jgi:hypothetical protein
MNNLVELNIEEKISRIKLDIEYVPSDFEEDGLYRVINKDFFVDSYGKTEEDAINNAKLFLREYLTNNYDLVRS